MVAWSLGVVPGPSEGKGALCTLDPIEIPLNVPEQANSGVVIRVPSVQVSAEEDTVVDQGVPVKVARVVRRTVAEVNGINAVVNSNLSQQARSDSCDVITYPHGFSHEIDSGGNIRYRGWYRVEQWKCATFDWICCEWFKCRRCRQEWKTKLVSGESSCAIGIEPQTTAARDNVRVPSNSHCDSPFSQDQKNLMSIISAIGGGLLGSPGGPFTTLLGTGAGFVVVNEKLNQVGDRDFFIEFKIPELDKESDWIQKDKTGKFLYEKPGFEARGAEYGLVLVSKSELQLRRSDACVAWKKLKQIAVFNDRTNFPRVVQVRQGENLWKIAEAAYGDGRFFSVIADENRLKGSALKVGQSVRLPQLQEFFGEGIGVSRKDTLWGIATKEMNGPGDVPALYKTNKERISTPDLIYPLQRLERPPAPR
jgi:hypothetical protein